MTEPTKRKRLPWYRRLTFRLGALVTLLLLGFDFAVPHIFDGLNRWLMGNELGHTVLAETSDPDDAASGLWSAVEHSAEDLLDRTPELLPARLAAMQSSLVAWRQEIPVVFLVCDPQWTVRAASPSLLQPIGQPPPTTRPSWRQSWYPLQRDGVLKGWLCLMPPTPEAEANGFAAEWQGISAVISQAEMETRVQHLVMASEITWWTLRILFVVVVALFFSWFVTRRLGRLAAMASADDGGTAMAAATGGSDEIASLANALVESRQRVRSLLDELSARDRARREWIAQVSHDLRTPLTALIARLERAMPVADRLAAQRAGGTEGRDAQEVRATIDIALADADRVAQLARDLLEAARLDLPSRLDLEPLLIAELVARVGQELTPLAAKSGLVLRTTWAPDLPVITGDGRRLLRVLENLIRNAIEHAQTTVEVRADATANGVVVEVSDDGPGLLADPVTGSARRADAAGLGLEVARRILASHGSTLELDNRPAGGCRSRFTLVPRDA